MGSKRNLNNSIRSLALSFTSLIVRLAILAICVLCVYKAGIFAYDFGFRIFTEEPMANPPGRDVAITIVQGDSLKEVCNMLEEKGLVRDARLTMIQKKVSVYDNDIQPGIYTLNTSMTADEMFAIIAGKSDEDGDGEGSEEDEPLSEAAPLTDGEVDLDALIDSTIPEEGVVEESTDDSLDITIEGGETEGEEQVE